MTNLEGSIDASELRGVLDSVNGKDDDDNDDKCDASASPVSWNDRFRSRLTELAVRHGFKQKHQFSLEVISDAALDFMFDEVSVNSESPGETWACAPETCEVPRSNLEVHESGVDEEVEEARLETNKWATKCGRLTADLDAALGAVRLLADEVGIESSDRSLPHKLAKQVHARVSANANENHCMNLEINRLRAAMTGIGVPDVPQGSDSELVSRQCQELSHHLDVVRRGGFQVQPIEEDDAKPHEHAPKSREERLADLAKMQQEATGQMIEMAMIDGFVTRDMDPATAMSKTMEWAGAEDAKRRKVSVESVESVSSDIAAAVSVAQGMSGDLPKPTRTAAPPVSATDTNNEDAKERADRAWVEGAEAEPVEPEPAPRAGGLMGPGYDESNQSELEGEGVVGED